jgi:hypothetical protein
MSNNSNSITDLTSVITKQYFGVIQDTVKGLLNSSEIDTNTNDMKELKKRIADAGYDMRRFVHTDSPYQTEIAIYYKNLYTIGTQIKVVEDEESEYAIRVKPIFTEREFDSIVFRSGDAGPMM